jgi:hypothetical protein
MRPTVGPWRRRTWTSSSASCVSSTRDVEASVRGEGATIGWRDDRLGHPLLLRVGERDLAAAGTSLGEDCRGPAVAGQHHRRGGVNLLLVHVGEVLATRDTTAPLRITPAGPEWPEDR